MARRTKKAPNRASAAAPRGRGRAGAQAKTAKPHVPPPPPPTKRGRRLKTAGNVRRALADVVRKLETGDLVERRANALTYALSTLANVISASDTEQRLKALEERLRP